jgi:DNA-binding response OmpR family regulator
MSHLLLLIDSDQESFFKVKQSILGPLVLIDWAKSIQDAEVYLKNSSYDLILLEAQLSDGSGLELCHKIQISSPLIPLFFLTSRTKLSEIILGFSIGADDYILKPFNPQELKARVEARLKKSEVIKFTANQLQWKKLKINKSSQVVSILNENIFKKIDLTALEFKLLIYFADRPETVINRDTLLNKIWGENIHVYSRSVDTHISKLRKKLGPVSSMIQSIHGFGYKFVPL